ncbi:shikimate dehydrogenase [Paucisalibacillus sp. EB02]|uniref:shikimate dehydrogenase n=1 Tax=Paucisalibacillus sp. EB02 TaxID=1347087 RepID=UPI0004B6428F|nr:shikimate dehydrogenase [Paucisalibacillus sp. EB02]
MEYKLGLIGYPVKHSLSPWIHSQFLENAKINGTYTIHDIKDECLSKQIDMMRETEYKGFNVTLPYKQKVIPYLDELDDNASNIGAVNTVLNDEGRLIGYNTDGTGYLRSLQQYYPQIVEEKDKSILIIGAGGAARGIYYALSQLGFQTIDIVNRTRDNAVSIQELASRNTVTHVLSLTQGEENIHQYDVIIQTTNVGMKPGVQYSPLKLNNIRDSAIVSDIIYQPIWTNFLKEAFSNGARIHHGHTMLLYQAQYAFELWFGFRPEIGRMDQQLKQLLEG